MKAGQDSTFHVNLTDPNGKPISDAQVTVSLIMPAMPAMGMAEMKSSFNLPWMAAHQMYMGKGQPPSSGTWTVLVEARKNGTVIATFHTRLSAK
jgi:nitrogen fixation protein FixH